MIDNKKQNLNKILMRKLRKLCEMHGEKLEYLVDCDISLYDFETKYTNGERCLSFETILEICNMFEYKFDDLLTL